MPGVAPIGREQHPSLGSAAGDNPGVLGPLGGNAGTARCKAELALERLGQLVTDVVPGGAVGGTQHREPPVDRITERETAIRGPEGKAIVECRLFLVLELKLPVVSAIHSLVDPRVATGTGGHEVGHVGADSLHIAKLQGSSAADGSGAPMLAPIGGDRESSTDATRPHDVPIHRTHGLQTIAGTTVLRYQSGLCCCRCDRWI